MWLGLSPARRGAAEVALQIQRRAELVDAYRDRYPFHPHRTSDSGVAAFESLIGPGNGALDTANASMAADK